MPCITAGYKKIIDSGNNQFKKGREWYLGFEKFLFLKKIRYLCTPAAESLMKNERVRNIPRLNLTS